MDKVNAMKRNGPPTLAVIARATGVSPSTVSAVLNNMPRAKNYNETTVVRIRETAAKMGYVANPLARTLKKTKSGIIGFVMLSRHSHYYDQMLQGAEEYVREAGYELITGDMAYEPAELDRCIQRMLAWRVEGLFLMTGGRIISPEILALLEATGIPYVKGGVHLPDDPCACVDFDNYAAGMKIGEHLAALGHRRIGVVSASQKNHQANERIRGLKDALRKFQASPGTRNIVRASDVNIGPVAGYRYTAQLIGQSPGITAIAYMNDLLALGGMRYLSEQRIPIPERLSITGFDDLCLDSGTNPENRLGNFVTPALTTVRTPLHEMGRSTMQLLVEMIDIPGRQDPLPTLTFEPELIVRESTAPPHQ